MLFRSDCTSPFHRTAVAESNHKGQLIDFHLEEKPEQSLSNAFCKETMRTHSHCQLHLMKVGPRVFIQELETRYLESTAKLKTPRTADPACRDNTTTPPGFDYPEHKLNAAPSRTRRSAYMDHRSRKSVHQIKGSLGSMAMLAPDQCCNTPATRMRTYTPRT